MQARDLIQRISEEFKKAEIPTPLLDAEIIVAHVTGVDRYKLITVPDSVVSGSSLRMIDDLTGRRLRGEPVAYLIGRKEFYSLDFIVDNRVLIPRPETELLVDLAIYYAPRDGTVLDIGTGSGAIAVAVKHNRSDLSVTATDLSGEALEVASANVSRLLGAGTVDLRQGDLFAPVQDMLFDVILSNPPYIGHRERNDLQKEVLNEPEIALFADDDGTAVIKRIILEAGKHLKEGGAAILEIGDSMKEFVHNFGRAAGFGVSVMNDYAGFARVAVFKGDH